MAWQDKLRPGSFRGVPFKVDSSSLTFGRRKVAHEFPQRDRLYVEDLGRKADAYSVEAYVVGDDYMDVRDALYDALIEEGPGQLVHPRFGTIMVEVLDDCKITESTREGGMARFTFSFVEAGADEEEFEGEPDTLVVFEEQQADTEAAIAADFEENFAVEDEAGFVQEAATDSVEEVLAEPALSIDDAALVRADPQNELNALLPENLSASLSNPAALAAGLLRRVRESTDALSLLAFSLSSLGGNTTPSRAAMTRNDDALTGMLRQAATMNVVASLATAVPATLDDAYAARRRILSLTDDVLLDERTGRRTVDAMLQLRTDALNHLTSVMPSLPRIVSITPRVVRSAAVLAHETYGDAWYRDARDDEIITRNNIQHPGFVPAGRPLQLEVSA